MNTFFRVLVLLLFGLAMLTTIQVEAAQKQNWSSWRADLRKEALSQGVSPQVFDRAFRGITPQRRVVNLDRSQPETRMTFYQYRKTRIDPYRITLGKREYKKNRPLLEAIGRQYGVDPCFIVSIWGLETSYGHFMGSFSVIRALATLAYDGRRSAFFRKELLIALQILNEGHIDVTKLKGEWAGASGHPQFLPSSWRNFAVDYDGDGKKDIWTNKKDALASIANYLASNGWKTGQPWGIPVLLPNHMNRDLLGKKNKKGLNDWLQLGVQAAHGHSLPMANLTAAIIKPYGGPDLMIFDNFRALQSYNPSIFYVGSVGYLAEKICQR